LKPIEDANLAKAINDKVNQMDGDLLRKSVPIVLIFTFFPFQMFFSGVKALLY
jgi:hypothetical protein